MQYDIFNDTKMNRKSNIMTGNINHSSLLLCAFARDIYFLLNAETKRETQSVLPICNSQISIRNSKKESPSASAIAHFDKDTVFSCD